MRIFFSAPHVIHNGHIQCISVGLVRDDGEELYMENAGLKLGGLPEEELSKVKSHNGLEGAEHLHFPDWIAARVREFSRSDSPVAWWGFAAAHDWVALNTIAPVENGALGQQLSCFDVLQYVYHQGFNLWLFPNKFGDTALGRARYARYIYGQMRHEACF